MYVENMLDFEKAVLARFPVRRGPKNEFVPGGNDQFVMSVFTAAYGDMLVGHPTAHIRKFFGMTFRQTSPVRVDLCDLVFDQGMLEGYQPTEVMQAEGNAGFYFGIIILDHYVTIENFQVLYSL